MRRHIAVLLVVALVVPQVVFSQTLRQGARVRVSQPDEVRTGTVVALTGDTLEVRLTGDAYPRRLRLDQLTGLDVSNGTQRHMRRAGVGLGVGLAVGAVAGFAAGEDDCAKKWICINRPTGAALGAGFFGAIGGVVGLIAGVIPSEKWERFPLEGRRVSLAAPSGGRGVGLRIAF